MSTSCVNTKNPCVEAEFPRVNKDFSVSTQCLCMLSSMGDNFYMLEAPVFDSLTACQVSLAFSKSFMNQLTIQSNKDSLLLPREERAQPPNLVNLSGAENFRSNSLSSRDHGRHKNRSHWS